MHILFVNSWYPSIVFPTNGDFIQRHAEAVSLHHKVTAIHVVSDPGSDVPLMISDVMINDVRTLIAYIGNTNNPLLKIIRFTLAYRKLILLAGDFNFVHVNHIYPAGIVALMLKWFKNKSYIVSEHWTGFHNNGRRPWTIWKHILMKRVSRSAKYMCPVTQELANAMQEIGLKGRYHPVPNVVKTDVFLPVAKKPERFTIVHVSNMKDYHKNISGLLHVIKKFQDEIGDFMLYMIGDDPGRYAGLIRELGIKDSNISLIDEIPQEELCQTMAASDIFVLFSRNENLPCVILESFSSGVPVISTNVGGIKEYFPSDFGILIDEGDEVALLDALLSVYHHKFSFADPREMHDYAQTHFSADKIGTKFSKLYLSIN